MLEKYLILRLYLYNSSEKLIVVEDDMVWWQGLLIVIGAVGLGILAGNLIARILPLLFSKKHKPSFSNSLPVNHISLAKDDKSTLPKTFQNNETAGEKAEQTWNPRNELKYSLKTPVNNRTEDITPKILESTVRHEAISEDKKTTKQVIVAVGTNMKDDPPTNTSQWEVKRDALENTDRTMFRSQKQTTKIGELKSVSSNIEQTPREKVPSQHKHKEKLVQKESRKPIRPKVSVPPADIFQPTVVLAESSRKLKEAREKLMGEIDLINNEATNQNGREAATKPEQSGEASIKPQAQATNSSLDELKTDLRIATTPWDGKPRAFQTLIWDTKKSDLNNLSKEQIESLEQAYIDMGMANHIVWLWADIGLTSKELENSYQLLCSKISVQIQSIMSEKTLTQ